MRGRQQPRRAFSAREHGAATSPGWPVEIGEARPPYLQHLRIDPVSQRAVPASGSQTDNWNPGPDGRVIYDFGKEISGRVALSSEDSATVTIGTGESAQEAVNSPWTHQIVTTVKGKESYSPYSAFRYVCLTFSGEPRPVKIYLDHDYYPVAYKGSFDCSDPLLTKIWYTGAYTAHLCMQEDIWDAPKRDRAKWMGDLQVSGETINNAAFLDKFLEWSRPCESSEKRPRAEIPRPNNRRAM